MAEPSEGFALSIERTLPAAPPVVFAVVTDPNELSKWWGPEGFRVPKLEFNPRVGASYRIEMQPPEGEAFYLKGEFRVVDPASRLAFTFVWEPPNPDDVTTLADLSFRAVGGSTEVTLKQGFFKTEERRSLHEAGWGDSFQELERLLATWRSRPRCG